MKKKNYDCKFECYDGEEEIGLISNFIKIKKVLKKQLTKKECIKVNGIFRKFYGDLSVKYEDSKTKKIGKETLYFTLEYIGFEDDFIEDMEIYLEVGSPTSDLSSLINDKVNEIILNKVDKLHKSISKKANTCVDRVNKFLGKKYYKIF
jgi:hypothetical protein